MPQMPGIDFIKKIREKDTDNKIKTLIISAYIKDNIPYDKSYIKIVDKILEKPVYFEKLVKVVQELISINIHQKPDCHKK
jgi:two-component SAPR family response regulator